ncbi:THUMP domain-containing protein 1 homolog [Uranotaenia lowii]|uniref:THUMP domain-containing protein 1 homolog n=1 Tax=Uranotaenia lowii TaxID=190385 RepID=UPI0024791772|nr:THUMP domain-containing protein 1 homolog [Uranotaenia lowii]
MSTSAATAEPSAKRPRMDGQKQRNKGDKRNYYAKSAAPAGGGGRRKAFLEPGQRGFMITCNMRERDCIRESYMLLNEYADELYGKLEETKPVENQKATEDNTEEDDGEAEDISVLVQKQAESVRQEKRQFRFESVETGAKNCCFISTILKDPKELGLHILRALAEKKELKSRFILRMMPIEVVTRANIKDIQNAAGPLFDRYFLKEPKTFSIVFNRRFNNAIQRDEVIDALAKLVSSKNMGNKANLKSPDLAVIVEIVKGLCLISVVPDYFVLRKFNVVELCAKKEQTEETA